MAIKDWLFLLCLLFFMSMGGLFGMNRYVANKVFTNVTMPEVNRSLEEGYEFSMKGVVQVQAQNLAERLKGVTDPQQQREIVEQHTDYQRFFGGEGYYFTYDMKGFRINVPINKTLNGKDCSNLRDDHGIAFVQEFIKAAQKSDGGYIRYYFEKPGAGIQPKLGYVCRIPGTDMLIGSGVYIDTVRDRLETIKIKMEDQDEDYIFYEAIISFIGALIVGLFLIWISVIISSPLKHLMEIAQKISVGDISATLAPPHRTDPKEVLSLRSALKEMVKVLKERLHDSEEKSREAAKASEEAKQALEAAKESKRRAEAARKEGITAAAHQLEAVVNTIVSTTKQLTHNIDESAKGAAEASERLTEAATAMNEMNITVQEVAKNASSAAQDSVNTKKKAEEGADVINKSVASIRQAHQLSLALKQDMAQLSDHAKNITQIMSVISDIADQTNLLALNAAIEAARAGEAGRGFAVVADSVRTLAEKTMTSTTDVGNVIKSIQDSTNKSVNALDTALNQIEQATQLSNQSGEVLGSILATIDISATEISSIATASEEQSAASEEINQSIAQVDSMARSTSVTMENSNKAINDLTSEAQKLNDLIAKMKA